MKYTNKLHIFKFLALTLCLAMVVGLLGVTACNASADGKDGKSAYDIWLEQGNTGSEQDFLDSLKGEKGDQGLQGNPGDKPEITVGNNGNWYVDGVDTGVKAQGNQGIQGPQGDPGAAGKNGPSWFSGAKCPNEDKDIGQYAQGAKVGDFYICAECGTLWKNGGGIWDKICCLKGPKGDKGDPGESGSTDDDTFKLNVAAGQTAEMPITDLSADTYVVEVAFDQKISFGRLEASVESSVATYSSVFAFSQERTDAANNGTFVYYGYVIVDEADTKITFKPTSDFELNDKSKEIKDAKVYIKEPWKPPTLKADGTPVEIILNSSNATADSVIKINLDESVGEGSYQIIVNRGVVLDDGDWLGIFDQTDNMEFGGELAGMMSNETTKNITISASKNYLVFRQLFDLSQYHYIVPATVSLTQA